MAYKNGLSAVFRNRAIKEKMNNHLMQNIDNGIYGLAKKPFIKQQIDILKNSGFIPEDAELPEEAEIIDDTEIGDDKKE